MNSKKRPSVVAVFVAYAREELTLEQAVSLLEQQERQDCLRAAVAELLIFAAFVVWVWALLSHLSN